MVEFNGYRISFSHSGAYEGRSLSNEDVSAIAHFYRLTRGRELDLDIAWISWLNDERGVRLAELRRGPERLGRLFRGGRVGIYEGEDYGLPTSTEWCQLRVMRERGRGKLPTAVNVTYGDMVVAAGGENVWSVLSEAGALSIGPESHLLDGKTGRTPVVTFPAGDPEVPVTAWVLTKALPILNRFKG